MYYEKMPYDEGIPYEGEYKLDKLYDLYIQKFSCSFKLKKGHIPTVQLKRYLKWFAPNEYLESSDGNYVTMYMTNVDLKLFKEHYHVYDVTYHSGYKFKSSTTLFKDYIDKWTAIKEEAERTKNKPLRTIAKLMLNNLYGKFSTNPLMLNKYPYKSDEGHIKYASPRIVKDGEDWTYYSRFPKFDVITDEFYFEEELVEPQKPLYIPVGCFITSYAREKTIRAAQKQYDRFVYADTDSLFLLGTELPAELDMSGKLGTWGIEHGEGADEGQIIRARFLRQKSYILDVEKDGKRKLEIVCAGMPESCYKNVTWENFHPGASYDGKLKMAHVPGGIVLEDSPHTLR